jgi:hypothetical protein
MQSLPSSGPAPRSAHPPASLLDPDTLITVHIRGILAILALAGCAPAPPTPRTPARALPDPAAFSLPAAPTPPPPAPTPDRAYLRARFGGQLRQIVTRAGALAGALREGVMSGCFEVAGPGAREGARFDPRAMADALAPPPEMSRPASPVKAGPPPGDWLGEKEAAAAAGKEEERVLCAVEFGLVSVQRSARPKRREDGKRAGLALDVGGGISARVVGVDSLAPPSGVHLDSRDGGAGAQVREERSVLLKPKVLLRSVTDVLDAP